MAYILSVAQIDGEWKVFGTYTDLGCIKTIAREHQSKSEDYLLYRITDSDGVLIALGNALTTTYGFRMQWVSFEITPRTIF